MIHQNDAAFAMPSTEGNFSQEGLTKREYFAIQIFAAHISGLYSGNFVIDDQKIAAISIKGADALIAELNKT